MKYATKLDINFNVPDFSKSKVVSCLSYNKLQKYSKEYTKGSYATTQVTTVDNEKILNFLPKKLLDLEKPLVSTLLIKTPDVENPVLPIHVDLARKCAINIYLVTNNEKTCFYTWDKFLKVATETESFVSKNNEVWLLDVSKPHSVILNKSTERKMITMSFCKIPYETVLNELKRDIR